MTAEAARQQFAKLAASGLVEAFSHQRRGPAQSGLAAHPHRPCPLPDTHAELTVQLLDTVRQAFKVIRPSTG